MTIQLPGEYGHEILRSEVGSTLHGTGLGVALEDRDEMGIFIPHAHLMVGLGEIEHWSARDARTRENWKLGDRTPEPKSAPGEDDVIVYSVQKWTLLAVTGNPSVLLPLYAPDDKLVMMDEVGAELRSMCHLFASRRAGRAFFGYMERQRQRLTGERGRAGRIRSRGDCEHCMGRGEEPPVDHGHEVVIADRFRKCSVCGGSGLLVDFKYAMHMLRLGYQGVEYLTHGRITLPVPDVDGEHLRAVRRGEVPIGECLAEAADLEARMRQLLDGQSPLPPSPDVAAIEKWLVGVHLDRWRK